MIRKVERRFTQLANRRRLAIVIVGAVAVLSSALPYLLYSRSLSPFSSWSFFTTYDQFSYLLAADTYASGRLTNPTHEMWRHFETRSVNHEPSYQSMYPPGQGIFLAAGQVLTGHPIVGVWINMALAGSAICYLLQAWFPARWAFFGGLLAAIHARMALEWGGTYWGGGVAMLGGALTFGGLRHILNRPRVADALLLAIGLSVLANSRPFEGLVASVPALGVLAGWLVVDKKVSPKTRIARVVAPMFLVLTVIAASMAYYNYRVTNSPWTLPYQIYLATHDRETPFVWQTHEDRPRIASSSSEENGTPPPSGLDVEPIPNVEPPGRDKEKWWFAVAYLKLLGHPSSIVAVPFKVAVQWAFYVGPVLSVPLLALAWGAGDRWTWFALCTSALTLLAVLMTSGAWPHYLAPVSPLVFVLLVQGSRCLGLWRRRGRRVGRHWIPALLALCSLYWILLVALFPQTMKGLRWGDARTQLQAQLEGMDDDHLAIVRYGPGHNWYEEWVYNKADIDGAKVVWARELSPDSNQLLLAYFKGRRVWLVEPDRDPPTLVPYDPYRRSMAAPSSP